MEQRLRLVQGSAGRGRQAMRRAAPSAGARADRLEGSPGQTQMAVVVTRDVSEHGVSFECRTGLTDPAVSAGLLPGRPPVAPPRRPVADPAQAERAVGGVPCRPVERGHRHAHRIRAAPAGRAEGRPPTHGSDASYEDGVTRRALRAHGADTSGGLAKWIDGTMGRTSDGRCGTGRRRTDYAVIRGACARAACTGDEFPHPRASSPPALRRRKSRRTAQRECPAPSAQVLAQLFRASSLSRRASAAYSDCGNSSTIRENARAASSLRPGSHVGAAERHQHAVHRHLCSWCRCSAPGRSSIALSYLPCAACASASPSRAGAAVDRGCRPCRRLPGSAAPLPRSGRARRARDAA